MAEVARVAIETPLPHLDRLFDFAIPEELDSSALPGCRVKVRFHGRQVAGWLIERGEGEFSGALQPLLKVAGPPVLTAEVAALCRRVADRYAGSLTDVLRFAVPARVAAVEKQPTPQAADPPDAVDLAGWSDYGDAHSFLNGRSGAGSWICHPRDDPFAMLAAAAVNAAARGRAAVLVVPDARDVRALHAACTELVDPALIAVVSGEASNRKRYKTHLSILAGAQPIVIGTRSAVFAPVPDLGLIAVWDDGDDILAEPQTPAGTPGKWQPCARGNTRGWCSWEGSCGRRQPRSGWWTGTPRTFGWFARPPGTGASAWTRSTSRRPTAAGFPVGASRSCEPASRPGPFWCKCPG